MCDIICGKKKPNFAWWLTIWLSFERREIFLETVLKILLICVCHFSCYLQLHPASDVLKPALLAWSRSLNLKRAVVSGVSVSSPLTCILYLVGIGAIRFLQHHPNISLKLCCKSLRILSMLSLAVLRVSSSANKLHCTDGRVRHIGRSLIKVQNKRGPMVDPWGPPLVIDVSWKYVPYASTHCRQPCR